MILSQWLSFHVMTCADAEIQYTRARIITTGRVTVSQTIKRPHRWRHRRRVASHVISSFDCSCPCRVRHIELSVADNEAARVINRGKIRWRSSTESDRERCVNCGQLRSVGWSVGVSVTAQSTLTDCVAVTCWYFFRSDADTDITVQFHFLASPRRQQDDKTACVVAQIRRELTTDQIYGSLLPQNTASGWEWAKESRRVSGQPWTRGLGSRHDDLRHIIWRGHHPVTWHCCWDELNNNTVIATVLHCSAFHGRKWRGDARVHQDTLGELLAWIKRRALIVHCPANSFTHSSVYFRHWDHAWAQNMQICKHANIQRSRQYRRERHNRCTEQRRRRNDRKWITLAQFATYAKNQFTVKNYSVESRNLAIRTKVAFRCTLTLENHLKPKK